MLITTKKFYSPEESVAAGIEPEVATEVASEEKPSLAAFMAKQGTKSTETDFKPIDNTTKSSEKKEEPKNENKGEETVETTTAQTKDVEKGELETPKKQEEVKVESKNPPIEETKKPTLSLQEVLKQQPKTDVLKALGYDDKVLKVLNELDGFEKIDFFSNLINEWKTKGNLQGYLKELSTDYSKMPPEEVMRHQLREDYPNVSDAQLNALYKKKVIGEYNLDSEDPDEVEEGKLLLDAEAGRYRAKMIENQKTKLFPEVPEAKEEIPDNSQEIEEQKNVEAYKSAIETDPYSKKIFDSKKIIIGEGEDAFSFPVDPETVKGVLFDSSKWAENLFDIERNPDGTIKKSTPKVENQILTAIFSENPKKFLSDYAKHFKAIGGKAAIEPLENAKPKETTRTSVADKLPKTMAEAMAKGGTITDGY